MRSYIKVTRYAGSDRHTPVDQLYFFDVGDAVSAGAALASARKHAPVDAYSVSSWGAVFDNVPVIGEDMREGRYEV